MNKIKEFFKSLVEKWKALSRGKKVSIILLISGIIAGIIILTTYLDKASYDTLYSNLEPQESARIIEKLKSENIKYRVQNNSVLVPKDKAAELRMEMALETSNQSKGYEIFDQSKFGVTDTEAKIMYQRALEGELGRTIKTMDEVDDVRVHLVLPDESVFARETEKATASVIIKPKGIKTLNPEQVKAIVALVSGSVKDLPRGNVQVLDTLGTLLSEDIFDQTQGGTVSTTKQQEYERQFEERLQKDVKQMLENVFGTGKVAIKVNSDLNFDSKQVTTIEYDKDDVVQRSRKITQDEAKDSQGGSSSSTGIDSQFGDSSYPFSSENGNTSTSKKTEEVINNEIGQTQENVIKAPGEVTRMTVSVIIDSSPDKVGVMEKDEIKNIVAAATGYDENRGDSISISAMPFNTEKQDLAKKAMEEMAKKEQREKTVRLISIIAAAVLLGGLVLFGIIKLLKKKKKDAPENPSLDVLVGDNIEIPKQNIAYEPVLTDDEDSMTIEKEIQNYANKKPDQVVEVIRTWLSEEESR